MNISELFKKTLPNKGILLIALVFWSIKYLKQFALKCRKLNVRLIIYQVNFKEIKNLK